MLLVYFLFVLCNNTTPDKGDVMSERLDGTKSEVGEQAERLLKPVELAQLVVKGVAGSMDQLSDSELKQVVGSFRVDEILSDVGHYGMTWCRTELGYRLKRKELDELSTEELRSQYNSINGRISRAVAEDFADDLPDSSFEAPSKDSDSHILYELLEERTAAARAVEEITEED